ncbi:MAG: response regulator [Flavobacteriaceae bacterium]
MKTLSLMLIEDDEIEQIKFERALNKLDLPHKVTTAKNGEEAMDTLGTLTANLPNIIIMDLNMPKMNGLEFLTALKQNGCYGHIPIIVLTTSENRKDIVETYKQGAASYIVKPLKYEDYVARIKSVVSYWGMNVFNIY